MTQIAIIQTAPQSIPTDTPPVAQENSNPFSPLLKKAVAETTQPAPGNIPAGPENKQATPIEITVAGFNLDPAQILSDTPLIESTDTLPDIPFLMSSKQEEAPLIPSGKELPVIPMVPENKISAEPLAPKRTPFVQLANATTDGLPVEIKITNPPLHVQNQAILQQLQHIINNSSETGTVSIKATINNSTLQYQGEAVIQSAGIIPSQILEPGKFTDKPGSNLPTLRQDMLGQYFEAKLNARESGGADANTQNNEQQNNTNNQQPTPSLPSNSSLSPDQSTGFHQVSTLMQNIQPGQTQNSGQLVILPSGTVVNEDNVVQQVVERFQINTRVNETKIHLKLHPAELGELKIDLTLKDGSIKAHVVAHSQQVQEIIEKNMIKLRNTLEDQGFLIDEILVTSESDSVPEFDLFDQQLSQQSDFSPAITKPQVNNDFDGALEEAFEQSSGLSTGLNIQA